MTDTGSTPMADTLDIQAIRAAAEAATEGPWLAREASSMKYCALVEMPLYRNQKQTGDASTIAMVGHGEVTVGASELDEQNANCALIAAARTIVPALCDKVERLQAELVASEDRCDSLLRDLLVSEMAARPLMNDTTDKPRHDGRPQYTDEDMAAVGRDLMDRLWSSREALKGWHPCDTPAEVVTDLLNERDELRADIASQVQTIEALRAVLTELLDAMDAEAVATLKSERMRQNEGAFEEAELKAADDATVDAILTTSEAINTGRRALKEHTNG